MFLLLSLVLVIFCSVTKLPKLSYINNYLMLTDTMGLAGMVCLHTAIWGHIDSDSAAGDSNDCRLELRRGLTHLASEGR